MNGTGINLDGANRCKKQIQHEPFENKLYILNVATVKTCLNNPDQTHSKVFRNKFKLNFFYPKTRSVHCKFKSFTVAFTRT